MDLSFTEFGPRYGSPIVFLHGYPLDHRMWQAQADFLASKQYRVLLPDLAGFGKSPLPSGRGSMEKYAQDVLALVDRLHLDKFVLVGFSMGGYAALEFARSHPKRLRGLCLVDTRAEADSEEARATRQEQIQKIPREGMRPVAEAMLPKMLTERTRNAKADLARLVREMMEQVRPEAAVHALEAMMDRPDQRQRLGNIPCPTLVMVGAEDRITPIPAAQTLQSGIPNAQLRIITGAAHLTPMEAVEPVNHFLEDWLKNLDSPQMAQTGIQRLGLKIEGSPSGGKA